MTISDQPKAASRAEAKALGLLTYYTGNPCKHGHLCERRTACGGCIECAKVRIKIWYSGNKDTHMQNVRAWQAANADNKIKYDRKWHAAYRAGVRDGVKPRRIVPLSDWAVYRSRRRARKLMATPEWDASLTDFAVREAADLALLRESATGIKWHVDHMIPLQAAEACGLHTWANLQVIPAAMNTAKKNRLHLISSGEWIRLL